ncbi:hypothetical protein FWH13_01880 [Candidatus Saccharibacteria bacterium]|nr:hypothetical protein [Candidatus Saccharibacteria bacterium]
MKTRNRDIVILRSRHDDYAGLTNSELEYINRYNSHGGGCLALGPSAFEFGKQPDKKLSRQSVCVNFALGTVDSSRNLLGYICKHHFKRQITARNIGLLRHWFDLAVTDNDKRIRPALAEHITVPAGYHLVAAILLGNNKPGEPFRYSDFHFYRRMSNGYWYYKVGEREVASRHNRDGGRIVSVRPALDGSVEIVTEDAIITPAYTPTSDAVLQFIQSQPFRNGDRLDFVDSKHFFESTMFVGYYLVAT